MSYSDRPDIRNDVGICVLLIIVTHDQVRGKGGVMAKRHGRPSVQYRYEHYDPRF
jgi:hypothetical protein